MSYISILEKQNKIRSGELSLIDNYSGFVKNINESEELNSFLSLVDNSDEFISGIENGIKSGSPKPLSGMVISIKDILSLSGYKMTCASRILENYESVYTATAVQKLIDDGAIIIGKTNCDEFAMGSSNENSAFGPVKNPVDTERVPGGSSGGSAVSVAADLCDASIGTDTGGSIRQPAAFTGVFGLKPTYGRVSRYGLTAFASSFDSIGPFTKNVTDAALILNSIAGKDKMDSTSADIPVPNYSEEMQAGRKFTVAIPDEYFAAGLDEEIKTGIDSVIEWLKDKGHKIVPVSLKHTEYSIAAYYVLTTAEASSNLARYDGVRFGLRSKDSSTLTEMYVNSREQGFGPEVKRRIMLGTYVLSSGYYDAYYKKAQKVRRLIKNDFENVFDNADIILTPTTPTPPFKLGEMTTDPLEMYLNDIFTTSANLAGIPAISLPIGSNSEGLPIGLQLMTGQFEEGRLFDLVYQIEQEYLKK